MEVRPGQQIASADAPPQTQSAPPDLTATSRPCSSATTQAVRTPEPPTSGWRAEGQGAARGSSRSGCRPKQRLVVVHPVALTRHGAVALNNLIINLVEICKRRNLHLNCVAVVDMNPLFSPLSHNK